MSSQQFNIGDEILFSHRGVRTQGRVFGVEHVDDDPRRKCGMHYIVTAGPLEVVTVHESQLINTGKMVSTRLVSLR